MLGIIVVELGYKWDSDRSIVFLVRRRTARLKHLFGEFELDASLGFAVCERLVRQEGRMSDDRRAGIPQLVRNPLAVADATKMRGIPGQLGHHEKHDEKRWVKGV